jgi:hypothetical protein
VRYRCRVHDACATTATYHLGYPQYREDRVAMPEVDNTIISMPMLATANPMGAGVREALSKDAPPPTGGFPDGRHALAPARALPGPRSGGARLEALLCGPARRPQRVRGYRKERLARTPSSLRRCRTSLARPSAPTPISSMSLAGWRTRALLDLPRRGHRTARRRGDAGAFRTRCQGERLRSDLRARDAVSRGATRR